jgi:hypothetical protein
VRVARAGLAIVLVMVLLGVLAGEVHAEFCAQMNQEVLKADVALLPGSNVAVLTGLLQTTLRIVGGAVVVLPVSNTAQVTATIYPATQAGELSFLDFSVDLATGTGSGTFSKLGGFVGPLSFQAIPCP